MSRKRALTIVVERGELVIRIGIDTLAIATDACPRLADTVDGECEAVVIDREVWARSVAEELRVEEEDGTTLVHEMLDTAFLRAVEAGSDGVVLREDQEDSRE